MSISGKVFAITGGASGIGLATAKLIAERGGTACIADVDPAAIQTTEEHFSKAGKPYSITKVDVSKKDQVEGWISGIVKQFGHLDGAANIAGVIGTQHATGAITDLEDEEWERIIGVNLTGCMYCLRAELRQITDKGSIVNMASIHGTNGKRLSHINHVMGPTTDSRQNQLWHTTQRMEQASTASLASPRLLPKRTGNERSASMPLPRGLFIRQ